MYIHAYTIIISPASMLDDEVAHRRQDIYGRSLLFFLCGQAPLRGIPIYPCGKEQSSINQSVLVNWSEVTDKRGISVCYRRAAGLVTRGVGIDRCCNSQDRILPQTRHHLYPILACLRFIGSDTISPIIV